LASSTEFNFVQLTIISFGFDFHVAMVTVIFLFKNSDNQTVATLRLFGKSQEPLIYRISGFFRSFRNF
jgi:hypothetical protein